MAPSWYTYGYHRGYGYRGHRGWYRSGWYGNPGYCGIDFNAWVFVRNAHFHGMNIAKHALLPGVGAGFFTSGAALPVGEMLDLDYVRRATGLSIPSVAMDRKVFNVNGRQVTHYLPRGQEALVRGAALETVNKALAPGFQRHGVSFKGTAAKNGASVNKMFGQEGRAPKTTSFKQAGMSSTHAKDPYFQKQSRILGEQAGKAAATESAGPSKGLSGGNSATTKRASELGSGSRSKTGSTISGGSRVSKPSGGSKATIPGGSRASKPSGAGKTTIPGSSRVSQPSKGGESKSRTGGGMPRGSSGRVSKPGQTGSSSTRSKATNPGKPADPAGRGKGTSSSSKWEQGNRSKPAGKPDQKPSGGSSSMKNGSRSGTKSKPAGGSRQQGSASNKGKASNKNKSSKSKKK